MKSQVRFNRLPEKVPKKVPGGFAAEPGQVQQGAGEDSGEGLGSLVQSQVRFNRICGHLTHGNPAEVLPALGFAARFRKIYKMKGCGCWGYHRSLFFEKTPPVSNLNPRGPSRTSHLPHHHGRTSRAGCQRPSSSR